jgi:hypothetical protein
MKLAVSSPPKISASSAASAVQPECISRQT